MLISCRKNNEQPIQEQELNGLLLHNITKQPIPGDKADLYVTEFWIDKTRRDPSEYPDGLPTYYTAKYSSITDATGRFSFKFKPQHDWTYDLHINTPSSIFAGSNTWGIMKMSRSAYTAHKLTDTLYAEKPGYINYMIQNVAPGYEKDSLHMYSTYATYTRNHKLGLYTWLSLFKMAYSFYPGTVFMYSGADLNKQILDTVPAEGNRKYFVKWIHSRNGIIQVVEDSIPVTPFSTSNYTIHY